METVADLVRRARDRSAPLHEQHAAFARLVERFERAALGAALRASDDAEAARDACQEAFTLAWRTLPRLREPAAFGGWLERLVRTQCARARKRGQQPKYEVLDFGCCPLERRELQRAMRRVIDGLPPLERDAVLLFHLLGEPLRVVARELHVSVARAGRILFDARLRMRRAMPRTVAREILGRLPTSAFARRVQDGVFDEVVGDYRFEARPDLLVRIRREGDRLISYSADQRHVLAARVSESLVTTEFDGEGRFRRDARGRVTGFVYYEFGRRLGVARKVV